MKRSLIAVAALLLLLSSTTFATPRRRPRRAPRARFWSTLLCWLGHNHHHGHGRCAPRHEYGRMPSGYRGRPNRGWHFGWKNGRHNRWDRNDPHRGERRGSDRPRGGKRGRGRGHGGGQGRGRG